MTTILVSLAFLLGLIVGVVGVWRWGGLLRSKGEFDLDGEVIQYGKEAQVAIRERIARRKDRIMEAATALGKITNDGVEDLFCISDRTASTYLRQLTEEGRLKREGSGRGTFYVPIEK